MIDKYRWNNYCLITKYGSEIIQRSITTGENKMKYSCSFESLIRRLPIIFVLLVPTAAHAIPIAYQFHGEVTSVDQDEPPCTPGPGCPAPPVTVGQKYVGALI